MPLPPETIELFKKVEKRVNRANKMLENALALLEPTVEAALERDDGEELNELVKRLPCAFWRAEIRGHLMKTGRYERVQQ
jgi:hypothetical protein